MRKLLFFICVLNFLASSSFGKPTQNQMVKQTFEQSVKPADPLPATTSAPSSSQGPQRSSPKVSSNSDFPVQIYFDQTENGLILPPLEFEYELSTDGSQLKLGNLIIGDTTFDFRVTSLQKLHPMMKNLLSKEESTKLALFMSWPEPLMASGTLEMIAKNGEVIWKKVISTNEIERWSEQQSQWRKKMAEAGLQKKGSQTLPSSTFAILNIEKVAFPSNTKSSFRFCISSQQVQGSTKFCSQYYGMKKTAQGLNFEKIGLKSKTPRVILNGESAPTKQNVVIETNQITSFYAELINGETYEFIAMPSPLKLTDIVDTDQADVFRIVGYETKPIGKVNLIKKVDEEGGLTKLIGFESTIKDNRQFWETEIQARDSKVYLPGQGGGLFKQRFELTQAPLRQSRVYLHRKTPRGTYIDGIKLEGRKQTWVKVTSDENSAEVDPKDPRHFYWNFKALHRGQINRSYLNVNFQDKTYRSYFELYKGYPREISTRLSAITAAGKGVILGEVAYSQWFEDLFGWTNYYVSRQRWGLTAKYFQSLSQMPVNAAGELGELSATVIDLKFRANPGLWGLDEAVGVIASYQDFTFGTLKSGMIGAGGFWARSMPQVFDNLFNIVPMMRYPKWVDMEFIYYFKPLDSSIELNSTLALNFHGKVFWSDTIYGEAGFGMKRFAFLQTTTAQKAEINAFYGTMGLGMNF